VTADHLPGDVHRHEEIVNQNLSRRYRGANPDHAIVVHPGIASRPDIVDSFCARHADRDVDVWKLDARFSPEGWAEGLAAVGTHVAQSTRLPVFVVGASPNAAVIHRALEMSDGFVGAVLIGNAYPPVLSEQLDPSLRQNTKPVFCVIGETDTTSGLAEARSAAATGPVEWHTEPHDVNQLMLSHAAACSDVVLEWCLRQLSNHLNPTWRFE
jgi:hypothetical protein